MAKDKPLEALQNKLKQMRSLELPGTDSNAKLTMAAPENYLFDKILRLSFGSLSEEECTYDEAKVLTVVSNNFFGKNSGSMLVDANLFGVACPSTGEARLYLSLHYISKSDYVR